MSILINKPICSYCQIEGHVREKCYKLNGYPDGHKLYKSRANPAMYHPMANNIISDHMHPPAADELHTVKVSNEQLQKLNEMLNR